MQKRRTTGAAFLHYDTGRDFPVRFYLDSPETARQKRYFPTHYHDQVEIGYCHEGEGVFAAGRRIFRFRPGDTVVIPPGVPHHMTTSVSGRGVWSWAFFDPLRLLADGGDPVPLLDLANCPGLRTARLLPSSRYPAVTASLNRLFAEARSRGRYHRDAIKACVRLLLVDIQRLRPDGARAEDTADPTAMGRIRPALEYIRDHFRETVRNGQLARACAMSGTTFRQRFRQCMGATPYQYLLAYRVSASTIALRRDDKSLRAVAADHGFSTVSSYVRAFRRQMGASPRQWVRKVTRGEDR